MTMQVPEKVEYIINVLMKNGYADAAYARFRTLYELSVIADFIDKFHE